MSVELDEILSLSDRILVMFDGYVVGEVAAEEATESMLGLMMAGVARDEVDQVPAEGFAAPIPGQEKAVR